MYDDAQTPDRLFDTLESKACHLWHADWECAMCQVSGEQHPVSVPRNTEPPRLLWRLFGLSHAAIATGLASCR